MRERKKYISQGRITNLSKESAPGMLSFMWGFAKGTEMQEIESAPKSYRMNKRLAR